jgi:hypothetical protein
MAVEPILHAGSRADREIAQHAVERSFFRAILIGIVVAIPICIGIWMGVIALGIAGSDQDLGEALGMAAVVGVFAAVFFGGWAGTVAKAHALDELEGEH